MRRSFVLLPPERDGSENDEALTANERRVYERLYRFEPQGKEPFAEWLNYVRNLFLIEQVNDDEKRFKIDEAFCTQCT